MTVTVDNTGTVAGSVSAATLSVTFTVSASATAIWAGIELDAAVTGLTCHLNPTGVNQAFTLIGSTTNTNGQNVAAFGLINPAATGSVTVKWTWTTSVACNADAVSFLGTATSSVANTFYNNTTNTGTTTNASVTVSSQTGDIVIGVMGSFNTVSSPSGTTIWIDNTNSADAANRDVGAASVTLSVTSASTADWCYQGCSVRQAAATTLPPGGQSFETPQPDRSTNQYSPQLRTAQADDRFRLIGKDKLNPGWQSYDTHLAWLVPERFSQWRTWTGWYNLNLTGKDKFNPGQQFYDLPPAWQSGLDPFSKWRTWTASYNLNLIGQDRLPSGQRIYDLPVSSVYGQDPFSKWRTWTGSYNLNLIGKDVLPFRNQQDYVFTRSWLIDQPQQNLLNTVLVFHATTLPPGGQIYDLPLRIPDVFAQWRTWYSWYNLNLIGQDQLPIRNHQFYQFRNDWRPESPPQNLLNTLFVPVAVGLPPGVQWSSLPPVADQFALWRTWTSGYNPNLIGQDAFPPGAIWDDRADGAKWTVESVPPNLLNTLLSTPAALPPGKQLYERPRFFFLM